MSDAHVIANAPFEMRPFRENVPFAATAACVTRRQSEIDINTRGGDGGLEDEGEEGRDGSARRGAVSHDVSKSARDGVTMGHDDEEKEDARADTHFAFSLMNMLSGTSLDGSRRAPVTRGQIYCQYLFAMNRSL